MSLKNIDRLVFGVMALSLCSVKAAADCATSRRVAGSIPYDVIRIFRLHNPSGRTIALGLTQPLTEIFPRE